MAGEREMGSKDWVFHRDDGTALSCSGSWSRKGRRFCRVQHPKGIAPPFADQDALATDVLDRPSVQCPSGVLHPTGLHPTGIVPFVGCNTRRALHRYSQTRMDWRPMSLIGHQCNAPPGYCTLQMPYLFRFRLRLHGTLNGPAPRCWWQLQEQPGALNFSSRNNCPGPGQPDQGCPAQYSTAALRAPSLSNSDCFSASAGATRHSSGHCTSQSMPCRV